MPAPIVLPPSRITKAAGLPRVKRAVAGLHRAVGGEHGVDEAHGSVLAPAVIKRH